VEIAPGESRRFDLGLPPERGSNVWRVMGPYGVGCTPGEKLSEADCREVFETTSTNRLELVR
jgi:hypothetical protein